MKKIKYAFWDSESKSIINGVFLAAGFTCGMGGVSFSVDYFLDNIFWSWDELENLTRASVIFTVAAD